MEEYLYPVRKMRLVSEEFLSDEIQHFVTDENIKKFANSIKGFLELITDLKNININTLVEIGCYQGESTTIFAHCLPNTKIYAVDPFRTSYDIQKMTMVQLNFNKRISKFSNIIKIKKESLLACKDFEDKSLDSVYIDGDHSYNSVYNDILAWKKKIKDGGVICGHDYNLQSVKNAINDIFKKEVKIYEDTSWLIKL